jgi:positive regulator of sigma E activity
MKNLMNFIDDYILTSWHFFVAVSLGTIFGLENVIPIYSLIWLMLFGAASFLFLFKYRKMYKYSHETQRHQKARKA